jgi:hypothetical protein
MTPRGTIDDVGRRVSCVILLSRNHASGILKNWCLLAALCASLLATTHASAQLGYRSTIVAGLPGVIGGRAVHGTIVAHAATLCQARTWTSSGMPRIPRFTASTPTLYYRLS